jgi:hypothetical protein
MTNPRDAADQRHRERRVAPFRLHDNAGEVEEHTTDHDTVTLDEGSASKYMNWDYLISPA